MQAPAFGRPEGQRGLQEYGEFTGFHLAALEKLVQEAGTYSPAGMRWDDRAPSIPVAEEMMAAFDAQNEETCPGAASNSRQREAATRTRAAILSGSA